MNWDSNQIKEDARRRKDELNARLAQIPAERKKLDDETVAIKRELIGLDQVLDGLDVMTTGPVPLPTPNGFTDKIRKLLSETSIPLVPTQIRDALEQAGVEANSSKTLLINVHTVLDRIDDELQKTKRPDGKIAYKRKLPWISAESFYGAGIPGLPRIADYPNVFHRTLADLSGTEQKTPRTPALPIHRRRRPRLRRIVAASKAPNSEAISGFSDDPAKKEE